MVLMCDNFSITSVFFMYRPFFPKMRMVFPKVKGMESAKAQGQATISTAVNTKMAVWVSPFIIQNTKPKMAMVITINRNNFV